MKIRRGQSQERCVGRRLTQRQVGIAAIAHSPVRLSEVFQYLPDVGTVRNERDQAHLSTALGAQQREHLVDAGDQNGPQVWFGRAESARGRAGCRVWPLHPIAHPHENALALGVQWRTWGGASRAWVADDAVFISDIISDTFVSCGGYPHCYQSRPRPPAVGRHTDIRTVDKSILLPGTYPT